MNKREKEAQAKLAKMDHPIGGKLHVTKKGGGHEDSYVDHENYKAGPIARALGSKGKKTR